MCLTDKNKRGTLRYKPKKTITRSIYKLLELKGYNHYDAMCYLDSSDGMCSDVEEISTIMNKFNGGVTQMRGGNE